MLPAFGGSGNLLVEQELLGGPAPGAPAFLGSSAAGAGAAADPGFFVEPESPAAAAGALGRQPFSPNGRRGSGLGALGGLGSGGFGSGPWALGPLPSGSLAPGSSRDLLRELECHEDLFLPSAPAANPSAGAAPPTGVTVVPPAVQQGGTGTSPPTPPTLPSTLRWHEALAAFPPLPPSAVPPPQPLQTHLPAGASAGYGLAAPAPVYMQLARPQPPALFVAPPVAPAAAPLSMAPAPAAPFPAAPMAAGPVITLPLAAVAAAAAPSGTASPAPSGSASSAAAGGSLVSGDNVPRIASLPNLHLHLHSGADSKPKPKRSRARATKDGGGPSGSRGGGSKGAKEKMLPRARSHNDLADDTAAPRAPTPAPGTSTAEVDAAPPSSQRFSVPHLPYLVPPHMRKGKGGRQPAPDPRLDPRIDPKKARRIMANRLSAAKSKLKNKSTKTAHTQRTEMLRLRRDELAAEVEVAAAVAHEEAEQAELRRQVQALEQQVAAQRLQHSPFETGRGWPM